MILDQEPRKWTVTEGAEPASSDVDDPMPSPDDVAPNAALDTQSFTRSRASHAAFQIGAVLIVPLLVGLSVYLLVQAAASSGDDNLERPSPTIAEPDSVEDQRADPDSTGSRRTSPAPGGDDAPEVLASRVEATGSADGDVGANTTGGAGRSTGRADGAADLASPTGRAAGAAGSGGATSGAPTPAVRSNQGPAAGSTPGPGTPAPGPASPIDRPTTPSDSAPTTPATNAPDVGPAPPPDPTSGPVVSPTATSPPSTPVPTDPPPTAGPPTTPPKDATTTTTTAASTITVAPPEPTGGATIDHPKAGKTIRTSRDLRLRAGKVDGATSYCWTISQGDFTSRSLCSDRRTRTIDHDNRLMGRLEPGSIAIQLTVSDGSGVVDRATRTVNVKG